MANRAPSLAGTLVIERLRALVPGWAAAMFFGVPMARRLQFDANVEGLRRGPRGLVAPIRWLTTDGAPERSRKHVVDALVPADMFLHRTITAPKGARKRLHRVAELDLRQRTPFHPDEIFALLGPPTISTGQLEVTQWVVKRSEVAQWKARLSARGLVLRRVYVAGAVPNGPIADFTPEIAGGTRRLRLLNGILAGTAAAAAAVALLFPAWTAQRQAATLGDRLERLRSEALALRNEVEALRAQEIERAAFLDLLIHRPLLVETLRELTVALPDNVWLANLEFRPERVVITGEAAGSAADTVLLLSGRPYFENPRLSGPVARTASNAERFEITLDLDGSR